jgi:hypothetical protein
MLPNKDYNSKFEYIIFNKNVDYNKYNNETYNIKKTKNLNILHKNNIEFNYCEYENCEIIIGGILYHIFEKISITDIINKLIRLLYKSEKDFFNEIFLYTGSFIIIYKRFQESAKVFTDAIGQRYTFYSTINYDILLTNSPYLFGTKKITYFSWGFPGNTCVYNNVRFIIPNTYICLDTKKIQRFFPCLLDIDIYDKNTEKYNLKDICGISKLIINTSDNIIEQLNKKILLSISGGYDSRVTLGLLLKNNKIKNTTYYSYQTPQDDIKVVKLLIEKYNLKDFILLNSTKTPDESYIKIKYGSHMQYDKYFNYKDKFEDKIHIRSQIWEIASFYASHEATFDKIIKINKSNNKKLIKTELGFVNKNDAIKNNNYLEKEFELFFKESNYYYLINNSQNIPKYYFWEHRMGSWQSNITESTSNYFDTIQLLNNWYILYAIINCKDKKININKELNKCVMNLLDPELLKIFFV